MGEACITGWVYWMILNNEHDFWWSSSLTVMNSDKHENKTLPLLTTWDHIVATIEWLSDQSLSYLHCTSIYCISLFSSSPLWLESFKRFTKKSTCVPPCFWKSIDSSTTPQIQLLLQFVVIKLSSLWFLFYIFERWILIDHLKHSLSFFPLSLACRILSPPPQLTIAVSAVSLALFDALVA